jgi:hypothetical protein
MASRGGRSRVPVVLLLVFAAACHDRDPPVAIVSGPPAPLPLITKEEVPPTCQFQGPVSSARRSDMAYEHLQQQAAARGATHVVLDGTRSSGGFTWRYRIRSELFGRAYWCPPPPGYGYYNPSAPSPPPAAPPAAPAVSPASLTQEGGESCSPACQAGYACVARACVPTCSPPCAAGQVCSTDRICRSR